MQNPASNIVIGILIFNISTQGTFLNEWRIVPVHSATVAIMGTGEVAKATMILSYAALIDAQNEHETFQVALLLAIPIEEKSLVIV